MSVRRNEGGIPFGLIALIVVLLLFVVMGWRALYVLVAVVAIVVAGTYLYDWYGRRQSGATVEEPSDDPAPTYYVGNRCATCDTKVFFVTPGETTAEEIVAFAQGAKGWSENPDALEGHMPPGVFCPNGCFSIVGQFPLPWPPVPGDRQARIVATFADLLDQAGKEEGDVYERQQALMTTCRKEKRRFRATMPYRSRFHCQECGLETGEAEIYLEDPEQTPTYEPPKWLWVGRPRGGYAEVLASELHAVLKHDAMPTPTLATLLINVPEERG